jgi:hypothetical protein
MPPFPHAPVGAQDLLALVLLVPPVLVLLVLPRRALELPPAWLPLPVAAAVVVKTEEAPQRCERWWKSHEKTQTTITEQLTRTHARTHARTHQQRRSGHRAGR